MTKTSQMRKQLAEEFGVRLYHHLVDVGQPDAKQLARIATAYNHTHRIQDDVYNAVIDGWRMGRDAHTEAMRKKPDDATLLATLGV